MNQTKTETNSGNETKGIWYDFPEEAVLVAVLKKRREEKIDRDNKEHLNNRQRHEN